MQRSQRRALTARPAISMVFFMYFVWLSLQGRSIKLDMVKVQLRCHERYIRFVGLNVWY